MDLPVNSTASTALTRLRQNISELVARVNERRSFVDFDESNNELSLLNLQEYESDDNNNEAIEPNDVIAQILNGNISESSDSDSDFYTDADSNTRNGRLFSTDSNSDIGSGTGSGSNTGSGSDTGSDTGSDSDSDFYTDADSNTRNGRLFSTDSDSDIGSGTGSGTEVLDNFAEILCETPSNKNITVGSAILNIKPIPKLPSDKAITVKDLNKYRYKFYTKDKEITNIGKKYGNEQNPKYIKIHNTLFDDNINNFDENNWILPSEITYDNNMDNNRFNEKLEEITSFSEVNNSIINMNMIDPSEIDANFTAYYNSMNATINNITNTILYNATSFYPPQKFMFAFILKAIRYEKRAIKYLVNSPMMDFDLIPVAINTKKDSIPKYMIKFFDNEIYKLLFPKNDLIEALIKLYPEVNPLAHSITNDKSNFYKVVEIFGEDLVFKIPTTPANIKGTNFIATALDYAIAFQPEIAIWIINHPLATEEYVKVPCFLGNYGNVSILHYACLLKNFDLVLEISRSQFGKVLINENMFDIIVKMFTHDQITQYYQEFKELLSIANISYKSICILLNEPELLVEILFSKGQQINKKQFSNVINDIIAYRPNILQLILEKYKKEIKLQTSSLLYITPYLFKYYSKENESIYGEFVSEHSLEILKNNKITNILIKRGYDIDFINFDLDFIQKDYEGYNNYVHLCLNNPDVALSLTGILDFETLRACIFQLFALVSNTCILETIIDHAVNINCVNYLIHMRTGSRNLLLNTAIYNPDMVKLLLPHVDEETFKLVDEQGYNIIHLAAMFANVDTIKDIMNCRWWSTDLLSQSNVNILDCIVHNLNKEVCTLFENLVSTLNVNYKKTFCDAIVNNNLELIKMIGGCALFTDKMLSNDIISQCLFNDNIISPEIVTYILNHNHCTANRIRYILQRTNKLYTHINLFFKNIVVSDLFLKPAIIEIMKIRGKRNYLIFEFAAFDTVNFSKMAAENKEFSSIINLVSCNRRKDHLLWSVSYNNFLQVIKNNNLSHNLIFNPKNSIINRMCTTYHYTIINEIIDYYDNNIDLYKIPIDTHNFNLIFKSIADLKYSNFTIILNKYLLTNSSNNEALYHIKNNRKVDNILTFLVKHPDYTALIDTVHEVIIEIIKSNKFDEELLFFDQTLFELMTPDVNIINTIVEKVNDNIIIERLLSIYTKLANDQIVNLILSKTNIYIKNSQILLLADDDNIFKNLLKHIENIDLYTFNTLIKNNLINQVKITLESNIDLTLLFNNMDSHGNNLIIFAPTYDMYLLLTTSKYFKPELIVSNKAGKSVVSNLNILNGLITDNKITLLTQFKNEVMYMLADKQINDLYNITYLFSNIIKKNDIFNDYFIHNVPPKVLSMIKDVNILSIKNKEGKNLLFNHTNNIPEIMQAIGKKIFNKLAIQVTNKKKNILMYMLRTKSNVESLYECITPDTLTILKSHVDYKGRDYTFFVRDIKHFANNNILDYNGKEPLYYDIVKRKGALFSTFKFNPTMLKILGESALALLCKYAPKVFKQAISCPDLEWHHINKGKNMIKYIIKYNELLMSPLIESNYDISQLLPAIFIDAIKFSPYVLEKILTSKYMEHSLLEIRSSDNMHCLEIAFNYQPRSLLLLWKSKHITPKIYNLENSIGYSVPTEMKQIYKKFKNRSVLEILENSTLTQYKNVPIWNENTDNKFVCDLCYLYEKNVRFEKCNHTCCLGCGLKLVNCHLCRQEIEKKTVIFDS